MKVKTLSDMKPAISSRGDSPSQIFLTPSKEYEVYALAIFSGETILLVVSDIDYPGWYTSNFFETVDATIPSNWICSFSSDEPTLIIGPNFIAFSLDSYRAMVELEPESVVNFWQYVSERESEANVE
jgi:hypothetical protein